MMMTRSETGVPPHVISVPRFEPKHLLYMALCLAGAGAALFFFWRDLNQTLTRFQDEPIGVVTRKQHTAQRRFEDRTLWDRLRRQSPVYAGDYIRTGELSGAVLSLTGGEIVELGEHTLIQLVRTAEGFTVDLAGGTVKADPGGGGIDLRAAGVSLRAEPGSVLNARADEEGFAAGIAEGRAVFTAGGETRLLGPGDTVGREPPADLSGGPPASEAAPPELVSPAPGEEFSFRTARPGVRFLWTSREEAVSYLVEISSSPDMSNPRGRSRVQDSGGELSSIVYSGFENGTWYWRVRPEYPRNRGGTGPVSSTGFFHILRAESLQSPVPQFPPPGDSLYLEDKKEAVYFSWGPEADAVSYTFFLSRREDLGEPLVTQKVRDNYAVFSLKNEKLVPGTYYWGVCQTGADGLDSALSAARRVVVAAGPPPEIPSPEIPPPETAPVPAAIAPPAEPAAAETRPAAGPAPRDAAPPAAAEASAPEPPPLGAPGDMRPPSGYVLTEETILQDRQIAFSWSAVPGASSYDFVIYQVERNGRREILRRTQNETRFTLTDLAVLDAGAFIWRVEPRPAAAGQRAEAGESGFTVSIAETQASRSRESGVMFGTE
jgi:hypothetical protein